MFSSLIDRRLVLAGILAATSALAGCGDLPRPFQGRPGATAMRLSQPPPARLEVPAPPGALLANDAAGALAGAIADSLQQAQVPAVATPMDKATGQAAEWRLRITAELRGQSVVPQFTVMDPQGKDRGSVPGAAVPAAAWQAGQKGTFTQVAAAATPTIAGLLTSIEAARQQSDPNSLVNRPAKVFIAAVTGAPGDGNTMLARQMRSQLPNTGDVVLPDATGADFTIQGTVRLGPADKGAQRIEVAWQVLDSTGKDCGRVTQLNDIPAGSLDVYWGDVAVVVVQQAASGVHEVISNHIIGRVKAPATSTDSSPGTAAAQPS